MLSKAFKSRTLWTVVALFIVAGFDGVRELIPEVYHVYVYGLLSLLATYFKLSPSQKY